MHLECIFENRKSLICQLEAIVPIGLGRPPGLFTVAVQTVAVRIVIVSGEHATVMGVEGATKSAKLLLVLPEYITSPA